MNGSDVEDAEWEGREDNSNPELMPVAKVTPELPAPVKEDKPMTAAQAKIDAVASLTATAYAKASELKLTSDETKALAADFPDDAFRAGASGKEDLIYIEHAHLRDRLTTVLGMGQWAIVPRSRWVEKFLYFDKQRQTKTEAARVYVEAMLIVRGCFVSESIGDMVYYPSNQSTNYGDAVEGAQSDALRRCCKNFGIGLQAWTKSWCDGWWERKRASTRAKRGMPTETVPGSQAKESAVPESPTPRPDSGPAPAAKPSPPPAAATQPKSQFVAPGQIHPEVAMLDNERTVRLRRIVQEIREPAEGKKARRVFFKGDPTAYFTRHKLEAIKSGDQLEVDIVRSDWQGKPMYWIEEWKGV